MASRRRSAVIYVGVVLVIAAAAIVVVRTVWGSTTNTVAYEHCTVGQYDLDPSQAAVASTMVGVATTKTLPERAAVLSLAGALQESKIRNLPPNAGDRDSVGVLQQRPSQGWGTPAQLNDVHYATGAFLNALVRIPNWQTLSLATAVQDVQISADGSAYAQHEPEAQALADALTGRSPAAITCTFNPPAKVAAASDVAAKLSADLPVNPPNVTGLVVSVPGAKWQTAAWFVANAYDLGIDRVGYSGKQWSRAKGWQDMPTSAAGVTATMAVSTSGTSTTN
ncbi:MAG: hypothetical protein M3O28_15020 [Actinomycetota bacterium]|nr:hypothetical protein [Actinomycetota bacterium]